MRKSVLPKLSVEYLLTQISEDAIMAYYLGVAQADIQYCLDTNRKISAPYRSDSDPSLGFTIGANGRLRAKDFGGYFWGDAFDAAGFALGLDSKNHSDFGKIMEHIAKTFSVHKYASKDYELVGLITKIADTGRRPKPRLHIHVTPRKWRKEDAEYWFVKYGINLARLKKFNIIPIRYLWFNNSCVYEDLEDGDIGYAYYFGEKDGIKLYKIYFPNRKTFRFFSNTDAIQGAHLIREAEFGLIIKGYKDAAVADIFDVPAIAPSSETKILTPEQMRYLATKWKTIFTLSDFDYTGIHFACEMRRRYGTTPLFITNGRFGSIDYGVKDLSDYVAKYGVEQTGKLIDWGKAYGSYDLTGDFLNLIIELGHGFR